jgi:o-succinylbenzoate---CoA ligase
VAELIALELHQDDAIVPVIEAIWANGDALCIVDSRWSAPQRSLALSTIAPTALVDGAGHHPLAGGRPVDEGVGLVMMTSGSTANPKAVEIDMDAMAASAAMTSTWLKVDPSRHRWLCCLPLAHIGGFSVLARSLFTATALSVTDNAQQSTLEHAAASGVTHVSLVTRALKRIDPSLFTSILLGGAAPPEDRAPNVVATYGMTETGSGIVYDGAALDGVKLHIDKPDDAGVGEILVASPSLFRQYRNHPSPFVSGPDGAANWFPTGDLGGLNDAGILTVRGRRSEMIVSGGEKIFPTDIEALLHDLPGVSELAVWKRADPEWGERVVVWIVPDGTPPTLDQLRSIVTNEFAAYGAPKELVIVDQLPRTPLGKIKRPLLI